MAMNNWGSAGYEPPKMSINDWLERKIKLARVYNVLDHGYFLEIKKLMEECMKETIKQHKEMVKEVNCNDEK